MAKAKYTFIIITRNEQEKHFRLFKEYATINESLVRDSFNKNAVLEYAREHKIKYETKIIEY